jgi:ankyrin repeat protein
MTDHSLAKIEAFLRHNKDDINRPDQEDRTVLTRTCENGSVEAVKLLVEHGADVNNTGNSNRTSPLIEAAKNGNLAVIRYLLQETNVDVRKTVKHGDRICDPLLYSIVEGRLEPFKLLVDSCGQPLGDYLQSIEGSQIEVDEGMADYYSAMPTSTQASYRLVDLLVRSHRTERIAADYLLHCLDKGHLTYDRALLGKIIHYPWASEVIAYLLDRGVEFTLNQILGMTRAGCRFGLIRQILEKQPWIDVSQSSEGCPTNMLCCMLSFNNPRPVDEQIAIVDYFVEKGGNLNERVHIEDVPVFAGANPILLALSTLDDNLEVARRLLEVGGDLNCRDDQGRNALIYACISGQLRKVEFVLDKGFDVNSTDSDGASVLAYLHQFIHPPFGPAPTETCSEVVAFLADRGLDFDHLNSQGNNALMSPPLLQKSVLGLSMVESLLDRGVRADHVNGKGETVLHFLVKYCPMLHLPLVRLLVERGADVNARDGDGRTLFSYLTAEMSRLCADSIEYLESLRRRPVYSTDEIREASSRYERPTNCLLCSERPRHWTVAMPCGHSYSCQDCPSKDYRCAYCKQEATFHVLDEAEVDSIPASVD